MRGSGTGSDTVTAEATPPSSAAATHDVVDVGGGHHPGGAGALGSRPPTARAASPSAAYSHSSSSPVGSARSDRSVTPKRGERRRPDLAALGQPAQPSAFSGR